MGHDHSLPGIESQGHESRSRVIVKVVSVRLLPVLLMNLWSWCLARVWDTATARRDWASRSSVKVMGQGQGEGHVWVHCGPGHAPLAAVPSAWRHWETACPQVFHTAVADASPPRLLGRRTSPTPTQAIEVHAMRVIIYPLKFSDFSFATAKYFN